MQQHVLDNRVCALAVLDNLVEIVEQSIGQFGNFGAGLIIALVILFTASRSSSNSSAETPEKLLTKLSGFLIS